MTLLKVGRLEPWFFLCWSRFYSYGFHFEFLAVPGFWPTDFAGREPSFRTSLHSNRVTPKPKPTRVDIQKTEKPTRGIYLDHFGGCFWTKQTWRILLVSFRPGVSTDVSALHLTVEVLQLVLHHHTSGKLAQRKSLQRFVPWVAVSSCVKQTSFPCFPCSFLWLRARTVPASTSERPCLPQTKPLQIQGSFELEITRAMVQKLRLGVRRRNVPNRFWPQEIHSTYKYQVCTNGTGAQLSWAPGFWAHSGTHQVAVGLDCRCPSRVRERARGMERLRLGGENQIIVMFPLQRLEVNQKSFPRFPCSLLWLQETTPNSACLH